MTVLRRHVKCLRCPAAELVHPILSFNEMDVECRISGRMQPLAKSVCAGDYTKCAIWKRARDNEQANRSVAVQQAQLRRAERHVLDSATRETIRVD